MNVEKIESLRRKAVNILIIGGIISIIIATILYLICDKIVILPAIFSLGMIVTYLISKKTMQKFKLEFKKIFVYNTLKSIFDDLVYIPEKGIDLNTMKNINIIEVGNKYFSNDYISGKYHNVSIIQSDVYTAEKDSDSTCVYFQGRWMIFDFNKPLKTNFLCISPFSYNSISSSYKYEEIRLEDESFNKLFTVLAENEQDVFYILTPTFTEKLKNLGQKYRGKLIIGFFDNKLHIGIRDAKDTFEPNLFAKIDEEKITAAILKNIKTITDFVDELNLDNDLFRREI